ncbi:GPI-anchored adhesin-like protein PGA55, partial [Asbolus verrucosus]
IDDDGFIHETSISQLLSCQEELDAELSETQNLPFSDEVDRPLETDNELKNFDITTYINEPETTNNFEKKVRAAVKKIDVEAQKYIVEDKGEALDTNDDVIDVETVFEGASLPVLEASDAFSLLEQFEASEKPISSSNKHSDNLINASYGFSDSLVNTIEMAVNKISSSPIDIFEKIPQTPVDIFDDDVKIFDCNENENEIISTNSEFVAADSMKIENEKLNTAEMCDKNEIDSNIVNPEETKNQELKPPKQQISETTSYVKSKQILDALPQELIARINESGKRKPITIIPPIPNKKRGASRSLDSVSQHRNKVSKIASTEQVRLDHDYCASVSPYPKEPQKDSGFESSEEDDRSVIRNQPTVKTADGKLMVSLLKVNTIRNNNQKKKLNLEEYKKRRFINSNTTSQSNSPASSTCSSPLPEDENLKRIKHHEKLMKMAVDLLNTPAKSAQKNENVALKPPKVEESPQVVVKIPSEIVPPPDLEVKTYVSIGTNTDISTISSSKNILASAQQLEEIKPLLQKVSDKINSNSFITSLIENIPKVKNIAKVNSYVEVENQEGIREDKIIHYLKKDRLPAKTNSVGAQTDFDMEDEDMQIRYRRRIDGRRSPSFSPSGSSTSSAYCRRRSSSSSHHSRSSRRSGSSSSRSSRDNFGFVTFANKEDAYEAVERGNDGHVYPKYDLSFGGRRLFCKTSYSDLDNMREDDYNYYASRTTESSFDALLRAAQEKIRRRKP